MRFFHEKVKPQLRNRIPLGTLLRWRQEIKWVR